MAKKGNPAKQAAAEQAQAAARNNRREQLRAEREAAERRQRNQRILLVAGAVIIVAAIIAVVVIAVLNRPQVSAKQLSGQAGQIVDGNYIPKHANSDQTGIVDPRTKNLDAPLKVEIYVDYQCPWCQIAETSIDDTFGELLQNGDISVTYRLKTNLDGLRGLAIKESSTRATRAAVCADKVDKFSQYHRAIFVKQPREGDGFTETQLREEFPADAGITGEDLTTFQACYDLEETKHFTERMNQEAKEIRGTPTIHVNGKTWNWSKVMLDPATYFPKDPAPNANQVLSSLKDAANA